MYRSINQSAGRPSVAIGLPHTALGQVDAWCIGWLGARCSWSHLSTHLSHRVRGVDVVHRRQTLCPVCRGSAHHLVCMQRGRATDAKVLTRTFGLPSGYVLCARHASRRCWPRRPCSHGCSQDSAYFVHRDVCGVVGVYTTTPGRRRVRAYTQHK